MANQEKPQEQNSRVARRKKNKPKKMAMWKKVLIGLVSFFVICLIAGFTTFYVYASKAPKLDGDKLASSGSTIIYDAHDKKITTLGTENRIYLKEKDIPNQLKNAITSIEDRRFYKHNGIDPLRIISAAFSNLTHSSGGLQGGSTLDQQLIKLSFFSTKHSDQTLKRKAQEAWLALKMDKKYSKDQILDFYINKVFMGHGCYGMQTAANYYYGKSLAKLDLPQTALIAGIPNAPSDYNPYSNPKLAKKRRDEVLNAMVDNDKISQEVADKAKKLPITHGLLPKNHKHHLSTKAKIADPYLKQVILDAKKKGYDPYAGSLKIYTNLDMKIQKKMYDVANNNVSIHFPNNRMQIAATIINPNNGKVVAMLGGRKIPDDVTFGLNRAVQTDRSNGSTAKPLMDYGPAVEYLSWATYHALADKPYKYAGTNISLYDWDFKYRGMMTMRDALVQSRNIPAIHTLNAVGVTRAQNFIGKLGFKYKKRLETQNGIGLPSSTLQNAAAYAAFANGGTYYKPSFIRKIQTADDQVKTFSSEGKQAMKPSTAYMITDMLKGVLTNPMATGRLAHIPNLYEAGKSGTVGYPANAPAYIPKNVTMDAWFNGYTKHYSMSIWTGYDHQFEPNSYITDSAFPISMYFYKNIMADISKGKSNTDWVKPSNVYVKYVKDVRQLYLAGSGPVVDIDALNNSSSSKSSRSSSSSSASSSSVSSDISSAVETSASSTSDTSSASSASSVSISSNKSSQTSSQQP
ncbi:transglycosylase domain-containing protein [Ligilactobacillus ceti]|uniref:Multimodular transpeptidase-transglycosylase PBP 1A n=1 Tax=Ligilactobacillus ceti DSM 22408 TaxID=1122146 RepID=A0A0R2KN83_9LACO|nr:PBP1A family penicillin-binding protein [Ligilactobacillus ceti]KRN88901.1 multimodular transpeptidase-transglycosylase PBP 1A [Ligilactobacillus ceti DSM 22408]